MFRLTLPLLLAFHTPAAYAKHRVCSWEDQGWYSPSNYGYDHYCLSNVTRLDATRAVYACWNDTKVADYGFLAPGKLEFACPCGSHGYADLCGTTQYWGVCVGPANEQVDPDHVNCYYMGQDDDCEWPDTFDIDDVPAQVDIWSKEG